MTVFRRLMAKIRSFRWPYNRFFLFLAGAVLLAFASTGMSLWLYHSSGSELLDMSRPSRKPVQKQVRRLEEDPTINSTGPINQNFKREFNREFQKFYIKVDNQQVLLPEAVSDETLDISASK